jgi:hypothetical protein
MKPIVKSVNIVWCISYSEWYETRRCFITIAFQLCFILRHQEGPRKQAMELNGVHQLLDYADVNLLAENINIKKNTHSIKCK